MARRICRKVCSYVCVQHTLEILRITIYPRSVTIRCSKAGKWNPIEMLEWLALRTWEFNKDSPKEVWDRTVVLTGKTMGPNRDWFEAVQVQTVYADSPNTLSLTPLVVVR